ncbi:MAG: hypothetical protein DRO05_06095, partial [Thermoproteota archaeon]
MKRAQYPDPLRRNLILKQPEVLRFLSYKGSCRPIKLRRIKSLLALYLATFVLRLGFGQIALLLPWKLADLGVPIQSLGFIMASNALAEMIAAFPAGFLSDRFRRKPIIMIGLIGASFSFMLYLHAFSGKMLLFAHATLGIFEAMTISPVLAAIVDRTAVGQRGQAMGLYNSTVTAGYILGPPLAGMMAGRWGRDSPFYLCSMLALFSLIVVFFLLKEEDFQRRESYDILQDFIAA